MAKIKTTIMTSLVIIIVILVSIMIMICDTGIAEDTVTYLEVLGKVVGSRYEFV